MRLVYATRRRRSSSYRSLPSIYPSAHRHISISNHGQPPPHCTHRTRRLHSQRVCRADLLLPGCSVHTCLAHNALPKRRAEYRPLWPRRYGHIRNVHLQRRCGLSLFRLPRPALCRSSSHYGQCRARCVSAQLGFHVRSGAAYRSMVMVVGYSFQTCRAWRHGSELARLVG